MKGNSFGIKNVFTEAWPWQNRNTGMCVYITFYFFYVNNYHLDFFLFDVSRYSWHCGILLGKIVVRYTMIKCKN